MKDLFYFQGLKMNSNLLNFDAPTHTITMTSREIAELTGKRHDNVMRDVRAMLNDLHGVGGVLSFEATHTEAQNGQEYPIFRLPKRETLILVSGYSVMMRARIVDRWQELEAQVKPAFAIPQTLGEALRLAADLEEQRAALALENAAKNKLIEQQQPHVEHSRALLATEEVLSVSEMAKKLNQAGYPVGQNRLYTLLIDDGILMKDRMPYQRYAHWFFIETDTWVDSDGKSHAKHVVRVNAKGEAALMKKYAPTRKPIERKSNPPTSGLFKPRRVDV